MPKVLEFLSGDNRQLMQAEIAYQTSFAESEVYRSFTRVGGVHADLFRNNVMFDGEKLTGFFSILFRRV